MKQISMDRSRLLAAGLMAAVGGAAWAAMWSPAAQAQVAPIPVGDQSVTLMPVTGSLNGYLSGNTANTRKQLIPIDMTPMGDGRQLVLTLTGHVRLLQADGTLTSGAYLDTYNDNSPPPFGSNPESDFTQIGNTSIATHPGFLNPSSRGYGKFYVVTTEKPETGAGGPGNDADFFDGVGSIVDNVITEWTIAPSAIHTATQLTVSGPNANVTQREILRSQRPGIIHTMADIAFTPDEYMVITSGDGGGTAFPNTDGSAFGQDRFTNSQDARNIFGAVMRIDPLEVPNDTRPIGGRFGQYRIHPDNMGWTDGDNDTHGEIMAIGVRSPYRVSVDQVTGRILVGDVGEGRREEINLIENGGNYGWGAYEGTAVQRSELIPGEGDIPATGPIWELYHNLQGGSVNEANNVVGGFVYRGSLLEGLQGMYIFADTGEDNDGEPNNIVDIYYGDLDAVTGDARTGLARFQIELPEGVDMPDRIWSMAEDEAGELYLLVGPDRLDLFNRTSPSETDGGIYRIVPEPAGVLAPVLVAVAALSGRRRRRV